jgi:hypothetical protein
MECSNCGSKNLRWHVGKEGSSYIADGRHCMREISVIAFLGCEECSETLKTIQEHEVEEMLNKRNPLENSNA